LETRTILTVGLLLAGVGCDQGGSAASKDANAPAASSAATAASTVSAAPTSASVSAMTSATVSATPSAAAAPTAEAGPTPEPCGALSAIPDVPDTASAPPTGEEWGTACPINNQGAGAHAKDCMMKIKREWLQVTCRGELIGYEKFEGFGQSGADYYEQHAPGQFSSFVVRLKKGKAQKVRMCRPKDSGSLFVNWPLTASKPSFVALGIGPVCESPSWSLLSR